MLDSPRTWVNLNRPGFHGDPGRFAKWRWSFQGLNAFRQSTTVDSDNGIGCFRPALATPCLPRRTCGKQGVVNGDESHVWPNVWLRLPSRVSRVRISSPAPLTQT